MASRSENQDKPGAPRAGAKSSRPAGRAAVKPAAGSSKGAATSTKSAAAKPASPARTSTKTVKQDTAKPVAKAVKTEDRSAEPAGTGTGVNREMKRMMKKREGAADRLKRPTVPSAKRTKPLAFLKEVRGELSRVAWPTRQEVITYSVVVLVTVIFFMVIIAGIDYVALKAVLLLIKEGSS